MTFEVFEDGVTFRNSLSFGSVFDSSDLDRKLLFGSDDVSGSRDLDTREGRFIGVDVARVDLETKIGSNGERFRFVVPFEPLLGLKDSESFGRADGDRVCRRVDTRECLSVVGEFASVEEGRGNFEDGDAFRASLLALGGRREEEDGTLDGNGLASVRVGNGFDARSRSNGISRLKNGSSRKNTEAVRKVNELE